MDRGIEPAYVTLLQRLHEGQEATVQIDRRSVPFNIEKGTKQGDPISPISFHAVAEYFMKKLKEHRKKKKYGYKITNHRYADDILLIARTLPQIKKCSRTLTLKRKRSA